MSQDDGFGILILELAGGRYGVPVSEVREVIRAVAIAPLAGAPAVIDGVINVRGEAVPVLNLRRRFSLPERELRPNERFVLVQAGGRVAALRADRAEEIVHTTPGSVASPDEVVPGAPYLQGVAALEDGVVLIHDPARFLSQAEAELLGSSLLGPDSV